MKNNIEENKNGKWLCLDLEDGIPVKKILEIREGICRLKKSKRGKNTEDEFPGDSQYFSGNVLEFLNSDKIYYISYADPQKLVFGELDEMGAIIWRNNFVKVMS